LRPSCGFRFPEDSDSSDPVYCPKCGSTTIVIENPYQNQDIPDSKQLENSPHIEVLLDNIRSTFNVGSIFRTADGAGVKKIHLCGITPTPDHPKVAKTALGAEFAVPWEQHWDCVSTAKAMKDEGMRLWALEGGTDAQSIFKSVQAIDNIPILLVVGNEVSGIDPGIINLCEKTIFIPMQGVKGSLNVAIAFGIAVYTLRYVSSSIKPQSNQ
jgi:23S rRNA (guanosine2251-2'-O)-methyltransferase